ncbi:hypothetical protein SCLCIDRAFT_1215342 [Scleroderma citrinum Foug A]|uniref:Uncharacterized protein n=1 Tax=Scleroderma citrinum Foug A TaxID=1036808 RepID=A0A0C3DMY4_9AGAM|nr:hypothetical protein SCLCIDRAFT_1215342 [Scleroderma citrinum Foug A]
MPVLFCPCHVTLVFRVFRNRYPVSPGRQLSLLLSVEHNFDPEWQRGHQPSLHCLLVQYLLTYRFLLLNRTLVPIAEVTAGSLLLATSIA